MLRLNGKPEACATRLCVPGEEKKQENDATMLTNGIHAPLTRMEESRVVPPVF